MEDIHRSTRSPLQFENFIRESEQEPESGHIYHHPALEDYDYLWLLDTDSFLLKKIKYDVFRFMHKHKFMYGYMDTAKEHPNDVKNLWEITERYIKNNNVQPISLKKYASGGVWDLSSYCSDFEIMNLNCWRSDNFKNYFNYLEISGENCEFPRGALHLLAVSMFILEKQVHQFNDIAYWHRGYINKYSLDIHIFTKIVIMKMKIMKSISRLSDTLRSKLLKKSEKQKEEKLDLLNYKRFQIYYNPTGVRANLIRSGDWTYDEDISPIIINELSKTDAPVFLDIGTHLGFMVLNILDKIPSTRVFAFEPGPFQGSLFEKTIEINELKDKVTLYKEALGKETGTASFVCQEAPDSDWSMCNGLHDTCRGLGVQKSITVHVRTLNDWWDSAGQPQVNVIKMDTEGAELWILEGGAEFLSACKPTIFLEIQPLNLHAYPYGAKDVFMWLNEHYYDLETIDGTPLTPINFKDVLRHNENFIARHKSQRG